jgi:hypothetical protein
MEKNDQTNDVLRLNVPRILVLIFCGALMVGLGLAAAPLLIVALPYLLVLGVLGLICWGIYRFRRVVVPVITLAALGAWAYWVAWPTIVGWLPDVFWVYAHKYGGALPGLAALALYAIGQVARDNQARRMWRDKQSGRTTEDAPPRRRLGLDNEWWDKQK